MMTYIKLKKSKTQIHTLIITFNMHIIMTFSSHLENENGRFQKIEEIQKLKAEDLVIKHSFVIFHS